MELEKLVKKKVEGYHPPGPPLSGIIGGILGLWYEEKNRETILLRSIYYGFEKLAKKYPEQFARVRFSKIGEEPHSDRIEDTLFRMGAFGLFSVENPKFAYCKMPKTIRDGVLKDLEELYGKRFVDRLKPIAKEFAKYTDEYERSKESLVR